MLRMSRVVTLSDTKRLSSGTQMRRRCTFTCCQRLVLMFECETLCALSLRLPVMSLLAMGPRSLRASRAVSSSLAAAISRRGPRAKLADEKAAPVADGPERRQRPQGRLVDVEPARELDLDRVDALRR